MNLAALVFLAAGLALLVAGADLLVRGSGRLALRFGISPLVIGLTVVAFGTSSPELAVTVRSGLTGQADIALGNIVGSNIFNVLVVLGLAALITPLAVQQRLVRFDVPLLVGASALLWIMALDGRLDGLDGLLLATGVAAYTIYAIRESRSQSRPVRDEYAAEFGATGEWLAKLPVQIAAILAGLALLMLGAAWLVKGAVGIAQALGVSEVVIGLTVVAAGTGLPELATSAVAALRGERDIAVGNVLGSSLFNVLAVAGIASIVTPGGLAVSDSLVRFDLLVMIAVSLACLPVFATGHVVARWEGALFLGFYATYLAYVVLAATQYAALPAFNRVVLGYVLPLTAAALLAIWARHRAASGESPGAKAGTA